MPTRPIRRLCLLAAAIGGACLAFAVSAPLGMAIVPPVDCGTMVVQGKRYNVKADQLRCATARPHSQRYLSTHRRPTGYRCRDYGSETKLKFRCSRGLKVFFAIKR